MTVRTEFSVADIERQLDVYDEMLRTAGLQQAAISTYLGHARRFVRWRRPTPASATDLEGELVDYETSLTRQRPNTITSYVDGAGRFIAWLAGEYEPRDSHKAHGVVSRRPAPRTGPPDDGHPVEDHVIDALVSLLTADGWTGIRTHSAERHEHGADIEAHLGERRLLVEAKGWPAATYLAGERKGQPKAYLPYTQGRAYFSNALLPVLLHWSETDAEIALAFPDQVTYRSLVERVKPALVKLGIGVYFVTFGQNVTVERVLDHAARSPPV